MYKPDELYESGLTMATLLYRRSRSEIKNETDIVIEKFTPNIFRLFLKCEKKSFKIGMVRFYFSLMAGKKYVIYYVLSPKGNPIHTSTVMPGCFKFKYLKENECEIGPCYTDKDFRGQGIYPKVLKYILNDYCAKQFYMTVNINNNSSIRGIEKAGFERYGCIKKSKIFKIYTRTEETAE